MDGMMLLGELENRFGVENSNVDWQVYESPTLSNVADYLLELSSSDYETLE